MSITFQAWMALGSIVGGVGMLYAGLLIAWRILRQLRMEVNLEARPLRREP